MKQYQIFFLLLSVLTAGIVSVSSAQGTAFMYQGQLADGGTPANGSYDLRFTLYDAVTNGNAISYPQTNLAVGVSGGVFMQTLDFGPVFAGSNYWLSVGVRTNTSTNAFTVLWPRQAVLPVPYAVFANSASNLLGKLTTAQLSGTLSSTQLAGTYSIPVSFTNTGNIFAGTFSGDGASMTNLNGSAVTSGTVADSRLSTNVALLNANQTNSGAKTFTGTNVFTGVNTFSNWTNSFTGSFFGNGLVGWVPVSNTATQAVRDTGYLLLSANLTTVTLPADTNLMVGDIVRISGAGSGGWVVAQNTGQSIYGAFLTAVNANWQAANVTSAGFQSIVSSADGSKMVASASGSGGTFSSTDGGKTWNSAGNTYTFIGMASSADGVKLVGVVANGSIYGSTNSGATWQVLASSSFAWRSVASSADGSKLVAVVNGGYIFTSTNSGVTWYARNTGSTRAWYSVACSADGTRQAAVAYNYYIYTSSDSGITWTQSGSPVANWNSIVSSSDGSKLAATVNGGNIYTSSDYGASWIQRTNAPASKWYCLAASADCGRLVAAINVGTSAVGGLYISSNSGLTWTKQTVADQPWTGVACSQDGTKMAGVYATLTTAGGINYWQTALQTMSTTVGAAGAIAGSQYSAVELQYVGNGKFMPISSTGIFWAN